MPSQTKRYLGVILSTIDGQVTVSTDPEKAAYLRSEIRELLAANPDEGTDLTHLRSLVGLLSFVAIVLRGSRPYLASLHEMLRGDRRDRARRWSVSSRRSVFRPLVQEAREDLAWWYAALADPSAISSVVLDAADAGAFIVSKSDASGDQELGWGFHASLWNGEVAHGFGVWTEAERDWTILAREIYPVVVFTERYGAQLRHRVLLHGVDNAGAACCICAQRSRCATTRALMKRLGAAHRQYDIIALGVWVPREWNAVADLQSRNMSFSEALARARCVPQIVAAHQQR